MTPLAELHLTVDTQIILIGNGMSDIVRTPAHAQLMAHFHDTAFLALDAGGQIRAEYERKMGAQSPGRLWLTKLAKDDRLREDFTLVKLPRKVKVELEDAHFHPSDQKFVRLAMATDSKCLIAEESDYSKAVIKVLHKHAGLVIHTAESACTMITTSQPGKPSADSPPA